MMTCKLCDGNMFYIGQLGTVHYGKCRACGMTSIVTEAEIDEDEDNSAPPISIGKSIQERIKQQ